MRVLAVAHHLAQLPTKGAIWNIVVLERAREPARDDCVVGGGAGIGLGRELLPHLIRHPALLADRLEHGLVIVWIDHHRDIGMVLGGRSDHRRAADVDVLDRLVVGGALRDGRLERIEVDHHEVDGADLVLLHRRLVRGVVAHREQAAMHLGMQRLDPAVHHLRKAGEIRDVADRSARAGDQLRRPARRDQLDPEPRQLPGEIFHAGLVEDAEQGTLDGDDRGRTGHEAPVGFEGCPGERRLRFAFPDGGPSCLASRANGRTYRRNAQRWKVVAASAFVEGEDPAHFLDLADQHVEHDLAGAVEAEIG